MKEEQLQRLTIDHFVTESGATWHDLPLSYQLFGRSLGMAPVVLVNHALTGNSQLVGPLGWWNNLVGPDRRIDTQRYTILAFNAPGNGYDGFQIANYEDFTARDTARIFVDGLNLLGIQELHAVIGGSVGGGIAWEIAALRPALAKHLVPIASDWRSTDWMIANTRVQEQILNNSSNPVYDARMHAMLCYRTPESFKRRFGRTRNEELDVFNVESWLMHHGKKLQQRFQLAAYRLMNRLLGTIDITRGRGTVEDIAKQIEAQIHIIAVDSDLFFPARDSFATFLQLSEVRTGVQYQEIRSIHGHDAFLIEFEQLDTILEAVFPDAPKASYPNARKDKQISRT